MSKNEKDYSNAWRALETRAAEIQMDYFDDEEDNKGYVIRCVNQFWKVGGLLRKPSSSCFI